LREPAAGLVFRIFASVSAMGAGIGGFRYPQRYPHFVRMPMDHANDHRT
jgi:hypothetical protein